MAFKLRGKIGVLLLVGGFVGFMLGQQGVAEYQTTAGQAARMVSSAQRQQYQMYSAIRAIGGISAVIGVALMALDFAQTGSGDTANASTKSDSFSGYDHTTLQPGSFTHYEFSVSEPSVLHCEVEPLNGEGFNVITTSKKNLERFSKTADIKYLERGTEFDAGKTEIKARVKPGEWAIILDNTGRLGDSTGGAVDVEIDYEVYN